LLRRRLAALKVNNDLAYSGLRLSCLLFRSDWRRKPIHAEVDCEVEYLYLDFGNHSFVMNDAVNVGAAVTASTHTTVNVVRTGLNYHF
jgi:hypothetical protein